MASGTVSRIDWTCASRASAARVLSSAAVRGLSGAARRPRRYQSPAPRKWPRATIPTAKNGESTSVRLRVFAGCVEMQGEAEKGRKQTRSEATDDAGEKNRRHQEQIERLGAERRRDQRTRNERERRQAREPGRKSSPASAADPNQSDATWLACRRESRPSHVSRWVCSERAMRLSAAKYVK